MPELRDLIADPENSRFRDIDYEVLDRQASALGRAPGWRRTHEEREATRLDALAGRMDTDLWVFAYGSLMWDPAIRFNEVRKAHLAGFHRRFCLKTTLGRGTEACPGLMAGLDNGGSCHGLVFRITGQSVDHETEQMWRREMIFPGYRPRFVNTDTPQGTVEALAFTVMHEADIYSPLSDDKAAQMIAKAEGTLGSNLEYLHNLAEHFSALGVEDPDFYSLYELSCQYAGRPPDRAAR